MTRTLPLIAAAAVLLAGCAPTQATEEAPEPQADPCVFLAGGAYEDAVDFFFDYTTDPGAVDENDLADVIDRFERAETVSGGRLADALDEAGTEFDAITVRLSGGDPLAPVDYQALADSLDAIGAECGTE